MPNDFELSRRKALAALGTIGAASAGAGIGTSAYFSDQETFENNQLTAGTLDMKVDWEEHYSDWSDDESNNPANGEIDWAMSQPSSGSYYSFPVGAATENKSVWVNQDDSIGPNGESSLDLFMNNTSLEAYPDSDDDGVQDSFSESAVCSSDLLADAPDDMDPTANNRTQNDDTYDSDAGEPLPLINLQDVKPGDFGEVTFSFHLCTNPGYVWLNGSNASAAENGLTEPEADDPDENGPRNEDTTDIANAQVELLDEVQTALWYDDDCDNLLDRGEEADSSACVQLVLDATGSMTATDDDSISRNQEAIDGAKALARDIIDAGGKVGLTFFSTDYTDDATVDQSVSSSAATDISATETAIDSLPASGRTNIAAGIQEADDDLANCSNGEQAVQIVVTDGVDNEGETPSSAATDVTGGDSDDHTEEIFAVGTGGASEDSIEEFARPQNDDHTFLTESGETLTDLLSQLGTTVLSGEEVFFTGTLRDALLAITDGNGLPLSPPSSDFDEDVDSDDDPDRECFAGESTNCVGFSWWLPVNHANEIQSDSVSFDIGFYTEQCRHNDGAGMNNEAVSNDDEIDA